MAQSHRVAGHNTLVRVPRAVACRRSDAERSLARTDGSHDGDQTVTYDKGGFVFWSSGT